jgi:hypothetical protein
MRLNPEVLGGGSLPGVPVCCSPLLSGSALAPNGSRPPPLLLETFSVFVGA